MEKIRSGRSGLVGVFLNIILFLLMCAWASKSLEAGVRQPARKGQISPTIRDQVKQIYTFQLGVRERGHNSGTEVESYLRYVDLPKGNPWCAAFICWVYGKAGVKNPRSGWSPALFPESRVIWTSGGLHKAGKTPPLQGDVFGIYFPEKGRIAHAGFIDEWNDTWVISVEGNTNVLGSREGDGVYRKRRLTKTLAKVARYIEDQRQIN